MLLRFHGNVKATFEQPWVPYALTPVFVKLWLLYFSMTAKSTHQIDVGLIFITPVSLPPTKHR